jgi:hypothetical protein
VNGLASANASNPPGDIGGVLGPGEGEGEGDGEGRVVFSNGLIFSNILLSAGFPARVLAIAGNTSGIRVA